MSPEPGAIQETLSILMRAVLYVLNFNRASHYAGYIRINRYIAIKKEAVHGKISYS